MASRISYQGTGPLAGLNVIDFGHYYAGPLAAMLLADQGANVIRIVRPGERELPDRQYRVFNRNKKLLTLDLKTAEGKTQALSLIERADVLIENFRPGVMKRLGLDYASVKTINPGLVYLSLPGFASTDKERAHIQAWEGVLGAAAGVYTQPSLIRSMLNFPPVYSAVPHCSTYGAMHGAGAVMAALVAREKHGYGTVIETPLVDAGWSGFIMDFQYSMFPLGPWSPGLSLPEKFRHLRYSPEDSADEQLEKIKRAQLSSAFVGTPCTRFHTCADGRKILVFLMWDHERFVRRFLKALGIETKLLQDGFALALPWENSGLNNNICDHTNLSAGNKQRLINAISDAFLTKTAQEWETLFQTVEVPAAMVRTRQEWLSLDPLYESGVFTRMQNGGSTLTVPGAVTSVSTSAGTDKGDASNSPQEAQFITVAQAEHLLSHSTNLGKTLQKDFSPQKKGELLRGLRILDMSSLFAGPAGAYFLATYGAEVIKEDGLKARPPGPQRTFFPGKRSLLLDIKTAPGRDVFQRLVSNVDVVLHNSLDLIAERLGIRHQQLQSINPNIITAQFTAYGGTIRGGLDGRQGVEPLLQAASGLMARYGSLESPQFHGMVAAADCIGGLALAFGVLLGVYQQQRTGFSGEVRSSLAQATNYYQLPWMIAEQGASEWGEATGQFATGESWRQRLYECQDGWIYVGATEEQASTLLWNVTGKDEADIARLEQSFSQGCCSDWLEKLSLANIPCHRVLNTDDLFRQHSRPANHEDTDEVATGSSEVLCWEDNKLGYPLYMLAPNCVRIGEQQTYKRLGKTPVLGEDSREILRELGYANTQIEAMNQLKVSGGC